MNKLRYLFVILVLCCSNAIYAQTTYYYKLTKKIQDGVEYTNTAGGQFVSFVNNICYDSDKYGISVGNGQLTFYEEYSNTSKTYIGNSYFGNVVYRFKTDMSVLNIIVNKNLIYVYTKTTPANNIRTCSLIRKKETNSGSGEIKVNTSQFQFNTNPMPVNTYSGGYVPVNTYSGGYDNNNTNTNSGKKTCSFCGGTGWIANDDAPDFTGGTKWCSMCNKQVRMSHSHEKCPSCGGSGKSW